MTEDFDESMRYEEDCRQIKELKEELANLRAAAGKEIKETYGMLRAAIEDREELEDQQKELVALIESMIQILPNNFSRKRYRKFLNAIICE